MKIRTIHLEPFDLHGEPAEDCSECGTKTRYWLNPRVPLCPNCAYGAEDFSDMIGNKKMIRLRRENYQD